MFVILIDRSETKGMTVIKTAIIENRYLTPW